MSQPIHHDIETVRQTVRETYSAAARAAQAGRDASCCGNGCGSDDPITTGLYSDSESGEVPTGAVLASLGCGNPTALAELAPGQTVLDLGSGGGIDVLLSARRVGPTGFVYGLDMTDEMLALAELNRAEAGVENVRFLKGHIEDVPLAEATVDVILSNCVINLSADKPAVLREAYRVLRPGGLFAVSDIVLEGELPERLRRSVEMYVGCVAGALQADEYRRLLEEAGFETVEIVPTRRYKVADFEGSWASEALDALTPEERAMIDGRVMSAFVRARKPGVA